MTDEIQGPQINSTPRSRLAPLEDPRTGQEHVADILSTTTIYIPSNDPHISHQILIEVSRYARSLEDKLAASQLQTSLPSEAPSPKPDKSSRMNRIQISHAPVAVDAAEQSDVDFGADFYIEESRSMQFVKSAIQRVEGDSYVIGSRRPEFWTMKPVRSIQFLSYAHADTQ